jgi:hypothetical protein
MSLFVPEENDVETRVKLEPGLESDVEMHMDQNVDIKKEDNPDITMKQENDNDLQTNTKSNKSGLKYYEDEPSDSEDEDEDDPIIDTIPIHLNVHNNFGSNSDTSNIKSDGEDSPLAPLLLQFPTKSRSSHLSLNNISALHKLQIKADSGVIELRLPLNTNNFFSETVSEKYNVSEQFLRGVIIHDEPIGESSEGNVSSVSVMTLNKENENNNKVKKEKKVSLNKANNSTTNPLSSIRTQPGAVGGSRYLVGLQDKEGHLHLTPISDTCMLRPHFTYIDNVKMNKLERERELQRELNDNNTSNSNNTNGNGNSNNNGSEDLNKKKNVSVVTMSAKSTKENIPRLGGALLSAKLEVEEEGNEYQIVPCNTEFITEQFTENTGNILQSKLSQQEYLDLLLNQTKL